MSDHRDPDGTTWEVLSESFDVEVDGAPGTIYSQRDGRRVRRQMTAVERADSAARMERYTAFMDAAEAAWAGPITALRDAGFDASLWQTGGMCLAIGAKLGDEPYFMLTSSVDVLFQTPAESMPDPEKFPDPTYWALGFYKDGEDTMEDDFAILDGVQLDNREQDAQLAAEVRRRADAFLASLS